MVTLYSLGDIVCDVLYLKQITLTAEGVLL